MCFDYVTAPDDDVKVRSRNETQKVEKTPQYVNYVLEYLPEPIGMQFVLTEFRILCKFANLKSKSSYNTTIWCPVCIKKSHKILTLSFPSTLIYLLMQCL